jgi:hypothetical protein
LFAPLPVVSGAVPTFRVGILQERQRADGTAGRHLDLPPDLNQVVALGPDPAAAFQAAVRASALASVAEAATFDDSAFSRIDGKKLSPILAGDTDAVAAFVATVPAAAKADWGTVLAAYQDKLVLVPALGAGDAFWVVDPHSGATTAMLRDGTGGAYDGCPSLNGADWANLVVGVLGLGCTLGGAAAFPFICLALTVASVVLTVASLIISGIGQTTSFGVLGTAFGATMQNPFSPAKLPGLGTRIGVAGVIIGLTLVTLECVD